MDQETEKMIRETLQISRENNEMLTKMFRSERRKRFFGIVKFLLYAGILVGSYFLLIPYLNKIMDLYQGAAQNIEKFQDFKDSFNF